MKFRYKKYGSLLRPVIPVRVKNGGRTVGYEVLVDSGADICIFDAEVGEAIGIDVRSGTPATVGGIAGQKDSSMRLWSSSICIRRKWSLLS